MKALSNNRLVKKTASATIKLEHVLFVLLRRVDCRLVALFPDINNTDDVRGGDRRGLKRETDANIPCEDAVWCSIKPPTKSLFNFLNDVDPRRWRRAQALAARGDQVLLGKIVGVFPHPHDFLDGDVYFRKLHALADVFFDEEGSGLLVLTTAVNKTALAESDQTTINVAAGPSAKNWQRHSGCVDVDAWSADNATSAEGSVRGRRVVPPAYNFLATSRAPIVQVGYFGFTPDDGYLTGSVIGGKFVSRSAFLSKWSKTRTAISTPFVAVAALNENWGFVSTTYPNRTKAWGQCCDPAKEKLLYDFLNHDKTLMLVVNQHHNLTHPKILTLPRGLPLNNHFAAKLTHDSQTRVLGSGVKKSRLLYAGASNRGSRAQILACVLPKFRAEDIDATLLRQDIVVAHVDQRDYMEKGLGRALFGLALPGLGYDCYRIWEMLTMGVVPIVEKGVGLDRTLHRLPALLVEDFNDVTPELLRQAYVEAVYRADEFEFERLTQSFWYSVIVNVSKTRSTQPLLDKFPVSAQDVEFSRPRVPYPCGQTRPPTCGPGTKKTPRSYC